MANETIKFDSEEDVKSFIEKIQYDGLYEKGYMESSSYDKTVIIDTDKVIDASSIHTVAELRGGKIVD